MTRSIELNTVRRNAYKSKDPQQQFKEPVPNYRVATHLEEYYDKSGTGYYVASGEDSALNSWIRHGRLSEGQRKRANEQKEWLSKGEDMRERQLLDLTVVVVLHKNRETKRRSVFPRKGTRNLVLIDPKNNRRLVVSRVVESSRSRNLRGSTGAAVFSSVRVTRPSTKNLLSSYLMMGARFACV